MATWCLIQGKANDFIKALQKGELDPMEMAKMTSGERHALLSKYIGEENATQVNALYESKLLLKDQQQGMINWIKRTANLSEPAKRDLITRIGKMDTILNPDSQQAFLKDLASTKIGADVTPEEASKIANLSSKIQEAKAVLTENDTPATRLDYGRAIFDMQKHLDEIRPAVKSLSKEVANIGTAPRALVASVDFVSAPYRHGWGSMSNPAWIKNYVKMPDMLLHESGFRNQMAKIYGSKYYDTAVKGGLKIFKVGGELTKQEEGFATNLLDKFPITRGSKRGYTGFLNGLRMDQYVSLMKAAELQGKDVSIGSKLAKDYATMVNNFTGAGSLGRFESAVPEINQVFFSPRMQVARMNMFNPLHYFDPRIAPEARIAAMRNLVGSMAISATALGLAKMAGLPIGTNPNETHFGEIKVGNTYIDVTGGNRTYLTFLSRMITGQYISSTGKTTQLDVGKFKPLTRMDLAESFLSGKAAPGAASILADILNSTQKTPGSPRMDAFGNEVSAVNELRKQITPLNITNGMDMFNNDPSNAALGIVLGLFGLPVSSSATPPAKAPKQSSSGSGVSRRGTGGVTRRVR